MERKSALLASSALTTSIAFISGSALAADMPVKAPVKAPVVAAPFSWSGCYIGGNVGGAWAHVDQPVVENQVDQSSGRSSSVIAGGQAGCNWQFTPSWVFGVEGDFNWLDLKRSSHTFRAGTLPGEDVAGSQTTKLRWLTTVRARLGYAWDRSLLYMTGGLAGGSVKSFASATLASAAAIGEPPFFSASTSSTRWGWTVGAGYEYAFTQTISGKIEYLHFDLGNVPVVSLDGPANTKVSGDLVRVGINVKLTP